MRTKSDGDADRRLGEEITRQINFQHLMLNALDMAVQEPPEDAVGVFRLWTSILEQMSEAAAALVIDPDSGKIENIVSTDSEFWKYLLDLPIRDRITRAVREGRSLSVPVREKEGFLTVTPCPGSSPPAALAVFHADYTQGTIGFVADCAATSAGLFLAMLRAEEERERGYRDMAAKVAHMSSGSIVLAQLRLGALRDEEDTSPEFRREIEKALSDLRDAQQGLDRARLLGVPWSRYAEPIDLGPFVAEICEALNEATKKEVVDTASIQKCKSRLGITLQASKVRVRYAIRDLALGTRILTEPKIPLCLSLTPNETLAKLEIIGGKTNLSDEEISRDLRDPEVFLSSPDEYIPERSIGFHLAWSLIEEIKGASIHPEIDRVGKELKFIIELPLSSERIGN